MKRNLILLTLTLGTVAVVAWSQSTREHNKPTAKEKLTSVNYLIGDWDCKDTVGDFSGTYKTTYARTLGDAWLRQTYEFPATQESGSSSTAEALMTYVPDREGWVRFFGNSQGQTFSMRMIDTPNGWDWTYVSFFKWREAEKPDSVFTKKSDREYTIDGPAYPRNGTTVTEHHVCRKQ